MKFPGLVRKKPHPSEPATLRAEARLSRELTDLAPATRLERLHAAIDGGEIDQAAFVRVLRYLAWWDAERAEESDRA